jgi:hypothetical protein
MPRPTGGQHTIRLGGATGLQDVSFEIACGPYSFVTRLPHAALV